MLKFRSMSAATALCVVLSASVVASAQQAQAKRGVRGQVLSSTYLPPIRLRFDKAFKYVGTQRFVLYERAQAEQFYFVDADKKGRIRRLYIVQFEGYLPNVDDTYDYSNLKTVDLGGQSYASNAQLVPSVEAVLKENPGSDAARAVGYLKNKGYTAGESVMFQRFVRLVDEAKRNELIVIYVEDLKGMGLSAADFERAGRAAGEKERTLRELSERALKGFSVLK